MRPCRRLRTEVRLRRGKLRPPRVRGRGASASVPATETAGVAPGEHRGDPVPCSLGGLGAGDRVVVRPVAGGEREHDEGQDAGYGRAFYGRLQLGAKGSENALAAARCRGRGAVHHPLGVHLPASRGGSSSAEGPPAGVSGRFIIRRGSTCRRLGAVHHLPMAYVPASRGSGAQYFAVRPKFRTV
jgi:hypothetical protein